MSILDPFTRLEGHLCIHLSPSHNLHMHHRSQKTEDKEEHKPLAALEGAHDVNEPNEALLERLRAELLKLYSNRLTPNQVTLILSNSTFDGPYKRHKG